MSINTLNNSEDKNISSIDSEIKFLNNRKESLEVRVSKKSDILKNIDHLRCEVNSKKNTINQKNISIISAKNSLESFSNITENIKIQLSELKEKSNSLEIKIKNNKKIKEDLDKEISSEELEVNLLKQELELNKLESLKINKNLNRQNIEKENISKAIINNENRLNKTKNRLNKCKQKENDLGKSLENLKIEVINVEKSFKYWICSFKIVKFTLRTLGINLDFLKNYRQKKQKLLNIKSNIAKNKKELENLGNNIRHFSNDIKDKNENLNKLDEYIKETNSKSELTKNKNLELNKEISRKKEIYERDKSDWVFIKSETEEDKNRAKVLRGNILEKENILKDCAKKSKLKKDQIIKDSNEIESLKFEIEVLEDKLRSLEFDLKESKQAEKDYRIVQNQLARLQNQGNYLRVRIDGTKHQYTGKGKEAVTSCCANVLEFLNFLYELPKKGKDPLKEIAPQSIDNVLDSGYDLHKKTVAQMDTGLQEMKPDIVREYKKTHPNATEIEIACHVDTVLEQLVESIDLKSARLSPTDFDRKNSALSQNVMFGKTSPFFKLTNDPEERVHYFSDIYRNLEKHLDKCGGALGTTVTSNNQTYCMFILRDKEGMLHYGVFDSHGAKNNHPFAFAFHSSHREMAAQKAEFLASFVEFEPDPNLVQFAEQEAKNRGITDKNKVKEFVDQAVRDMSNIPKNQNLVTYTPIFPKMK